MDNRPVQLASGYAAPEAFPTDRLAELASEILKTRGGEALQYGPKEGLLLLRRRIVDWLANDNVRAKPEETIIVTGAKQGLDLAARAFASPGDYVLLSEPNYMNGLKIFTGSGLRLLAVHGDQHGLDCEAVEEILKRSKQNGDGRPRLIYDVPDFQNPTGTVMAAERRQKLTALAARYGIFVLEDNPYRWLRYEGTSVPALKSFDGSGTVISVGTFAKILGPGLRLGWVHARRDLIDQMLPFKADAGTSPFTQMLAFEFFKNDGSLEAHLLTLRSLYRSRRDAMLASLQSHFEKSATWSRPSGGYYIWMRMPSEINTDVLAERVKASGVLIYRGSVFFVSEDAPKNYIRLCYAFEKEDRIRLAIATLADVVSIQNRSTV